MSNLFDSRLPESTALFVTRNINSINKRSKRKERDNFIAYFLCAKVAIVTLLPSNEMHMYERKTFRIHASITAIFLADI